MQRNDGPAEHANDRHGAKTHGGHRVLPLAAAFRRGHFGYVGLRADHKTKYAKARQRARGHKHGKAVGQAVDDGCGGKQRNGNKKGLAPADDVRNDAAHQTAAGHGHKVPKGDVAQILHGQAPVVHERRRDKAEVPVVHLLAEISDHDDEKHNFMSSTDLEPVKVVVADAWCVLHDPSLRALLRRLRPVVKGKICTWRACIHLGQHRGGQCCGGNLFAVFFTIVF